MAGRERTLKLPPASFAGLIITLTSQADKAAIFQRRLGLDEPAAPDYK
jgi:hypothetical protein